MDEGYRAEVQGCLVHLRRTGAVGLQTLRNDTQENAQHHVQHCPIALHEVTQPLGTDNTHWRTGRWGKT